MLDETGAETVRLAAGKVLDDLLRHEMHYWYDSARATGLCHGPSGLTRLMLRQVVATSCLLGARAEQDARILPARVPGLTASAKVARWLRELYPPAQCEQDWLGSLQPDRLAERHVVCELAGAAELTKACLTGLDAYQARRVLTLLARASMDDPEAEPLLKGVLPDVAAFVADLEAPPETLTAIYNAIPYPTVVLASAATDLSQRILAAMPSVAGSAVRAQWLTNLGLRLSEMGRPADALPPTEEAVAIYRDIVAADPGRLALRQRRSQAGRSWHATNLVDQGHAVAVRPGDVPACPETENIRTVSASGPVHGPGETGSRQVPFRAAVGEGDRALWHSAAALRGPVSATLHDEHGVASARIPADLAHVQRLWLGLFRWP